MVVVVVVCSGESLAHMALEEVEAVAEAVVQEVEAVAEEVEAIEKTKKGEYL